VSRITSLAEWILRLPLVWGGVACLAFYAIVSQGWIDDALMNQGWIESPLVQRYFAGHIVEYVTTALFFVGTAALAMRLVGLAVQFSSLDRVMLEPVPAGGQRVADCGRLLEQLHRLPARRHDTYLLRRLRDALVFVRRKDSGDAMDAQLRHLEELDIARMSAGYAMVRIIIWAIPILGFLGTVIGITMAIANMSPQEFERSIPEVISGLSVAFDTTALALALSMVLMFAKYCVERLEDRLLTTVDARASAELVGRFEQTSGEGDANVAAIRRMSQQVLETVEGWTARQVDVWKSTIDETHRQWSEVNVATSNIVKESLKSSLDDSLTTVLTEGLDRHAKALSESVLHHADRLSSSASHFAAQLDASTAAHVDKLDRSAQDTLGRLGEGLEKLAELLVEALHRHGEVLTISEKELAQENRRHLSDVESALGEAMVVAADRQERLIKQSEHILKEIQVALVEAAGATVRQQEQLVKQGDVLLSVVDATGQIKKLESTLNQNLATLRQGFHFEELALNLSAAIQLLCARLGRLPAGDLAIEDAEDERPGQAA